MPALLRSLLRPGVRLLRAASLRYSLASLKRINRLSRRSILAPGGPVVSLATYGDRLATAYLALESIARGHTKPARLLLWLDDPQQLHHLPIELQRLQTRGLEVRLSDRNYGPHKKYYPYLLLRSVENHPAKNAPLVTADDDILYPRHWLAKLVKTNQTTPDFIHCYRARVLTLQDSRLAPYATWPLCHSTQPSFLHFAIGVSGILYPPRFLDCLFAAGDAFEQLCPRADDIWLHANALRNGLRIHQVTPDPTHFPLIPGTQQGGLQQQNLHDNGNDLQAGRTYTASDLELLRSASRSS